MDWWVRRGCDCYRLSQTLHPNSGIRHRVSRGWGELISSSCRWVRYCTHKLTCTSTTILTIGKSHLIEWDTLERLLSARQSAPFSIHSASFSNSCRFSELLRFTLEFSLLRVKGAEKWGWCENNIICVGVGHRAASLDSRPNLHRLAAGALRLSLRRCLLWAECGTRKRKKQSQKVGRRYALLK